MKGKPKKNIYSTIHMTLSKRSGYSPVIKRYRKGMTLSSMATKNITISSSKNTMVRTPVKTNMLTFFMKNSKRTKNRNTVRRSRGEFRSPQTKAE